jgi:spore photoproduct lyase
MIQTTFKTTQPDKLKDISLGIFRVSSDYLKQMRKQRMDSLILQYPFENDKGVYHYSLAVTTEMISYVLQLLQEFIPEEKIYLWKETIL